WGSKLEGWLRNQAALDETKLMEMVNNAIHEEGRCIILAGARARKFTKHDLDNGTQGLADCNKSLRANAIGHIVIVNEVLDPPAGAPSPDWSRLVNPIMAAGGYQGLNRIRITTLEASGAGAESRTLIVRSGGRSGNAASAVGFICGRLHLIELHPG